MSASAGHFVVATLWEYIEPIDRGERYEDPLDEQLEAAELGAVCGGGTQLCDDSGIEFVNIEFELANLDSALELVVEALEAQGAPKGSELAFQRDGQDHVVEFGVTEGLALFLDGVNLPDEVYQNSDVGDLADEIRAALEPGGLGEIRGAWNGETETGIFMYGPDAEAMALALQRVFASQPLCQNARVVVRHGKPALQPRQYRLPTR